MLEFVIIVIVIALVAIVAIIAVARFQRKKLQKRFSVEIVNQGNVQSRYELRAEDPADSLCFEFALHGESLPQRQVFTSTSVATVTERVPATNPSPPARPGGIGTATSKALGIGGLVASLFTTLGYLLPGSAGRYLLTTASELRMGQVQVSRARQATDQVSSLKRTASRVPQAAASPGIPSAPRAASPVVQSAAVPWVQTPFVQPGETLAVDLIIRANRAGRGRPYPFSVISRSIEQENTPLVVTEGSTPLGGGFWTRRFMPYTVIFAAAIALVGVAFWLANAGLLG
jgi:hypothetical protein